MHPLDLVGAAPWRRVVFTTYALSLSFVEAVLLDRLVRGGGSGDILILSDPDGVRAGLSEQGARRTGREYELEPVACTTGVFHPKLSLFFGDGGAHMLVGSGNLTFGGWGANLEAFEHLHSSFAAEVFDDAADLFESMQIAGSIRCGIKDQFESIAAELRLAATGAPRSGNFRLLHSMDRPMIDQLADLSAELGGAQRICIVSPFFDRGGSAVERLSAQLGCENVVLYVHPSNPVKGLQGTNWPEGTSAKAVSVQDPFAADTRPLHAKCFEIICRKGRIIMTGSANATRAALVVGNVEASVVRIQRETSLGWTLKPSAPAVVIVTPDEEQETATEERVGVLRATLDGELLKGLVIVPQLRGAARLAVMTAAGPTEFGQVEIDGQGCFEAQVPDLEAQSWFGGRMVLRIEQNEAAAEGFVSSAAAAALVRRAGAMAPRLLAMLQGTETPADAAAILTWFKEKPEYLLSSASGGGGTVEKLEIAPVWVSVETLTQPHTTTGSTANQQSGTGEPAWQRALALVRSAFAEKRGPWKSGTREDDRAEDEEDAESEDERLRRLEREDRERRKGLDAFESLLDLMLAERHEGRHVGIALTVAHYIADRNQPDGGKILNWLNRILACVPELPSFDMTMVAAAALLSRAADGQPNAPGRARRFLLRHGTDPEMAELGFDAVSAFAEILLPAWNGAAFLEAVRDAHTPGEQVRAYLAEMEGREPTIDYPLLKMSPYWPRLEQALDNVEIRQRLRVMEEIATACPKCHLVLPTASREELRDNGVTSHCGVILCTER